MVRSAGDTRRWRDDLTPLSESDLDLRARRIVNEWDGIYPLYEAFYIHSIMYSADRVLEAFERYDSLRRKNAPAPDQVSAVHEALGHAAALSRFFWPSGVGPRRRTAQRELTQARAAKLRTAFGLTDSSPLKDRSLRDALEHFDERIDRYLLSSDAGQYMPVPRIGDSSTLPDGMHHIFKLVDPATESFVILDSKFRFGEIRQEATRILLEARRMSKSGDRLKPPAEK